MRSITTKLIILTLAAVLPTVFLTSYFSYKYSSSLIMEKTREQATLLLENAEYRINTRILPVQKIPAAMAVNLPETTKGLEDMMKRMLEDNTDAFGMAAAFEPFKFVPDRERYCPYVYTDNDVIVMTRLETDEYDYPNAEWYKQPKIQKKPVWSEPYYDEGGGNRLMSTFSYPVIKNGEFIGALTVDITIDDLENIINRIHVLKSGYAFLVSREGRIMVHHDKSLVMKEHILDFAKRTGSQEFQNIAADMLKSESGTGSYKLFNQDRYIWYKKMGSTGWIIGIVFPKSELLAPVNRLNTVILSTTLVGCIFMLAFISLISNKVTGGMRELTESAGRIAGGDFDTPMPERGGKDELAALSNSFESMRHSLVKYIEDLKVTETAKQKIESELSIARDIQMSILPKIFPPFPHRTDVDIYARMIPAKEVGGDLYDFYFLDENLLCFIIGDVSGKGVPASLFMAVSKTLIKAMADRNTSPGRIFSKVNTELVEGNDSCMFVTAFIGILDVRTGELSYANAGHNPPVLISIDGNSLIENKISPPLGAFDSVEYETYDLKLSEECRLLLYTDGVTEAMNAEKELYGEQRLMQELHDVRGASPKYILERVHSGVDKFVKDAEQQDDITILCLSRKKTE